MNRMTESRLFKLAAVAALIVGVMAAGLFSGNNSALAHDEPPQTFMLQAGDTFNSPFISPGASFSLTFADAGVYQYNCHIHPGMNGVIIVEPSA